MPNNRMNERMVQIQRMFREGGGHAVKGLKARIARELGCSQSCVRYAVEEDYRNRVNDQRRRENAEEPFWTGVQPEQTIIDENGREVAVRDYIRRLWGHPATYTNLRGSRL